MSSYFVILIFGIITSTLSVQNLPRTLKELWDIGFGSVNGQNLLSTSMSVTGGVILANSPQITLSYLYLAFNYLYTTMLVGHEWSGYMTNRKCLRVTSPSGRQRDTYWLSVPYRYAIPITLLSGLLHWLVSQSIFMVQITVFDTKTRSILSDQQISSCGFSPLAIIMATIVTSIMAAGGVVMGSFKYPAGMPLVGSCSAAISASCHPPDTDMDAQLRPVQWGAVTHGEDGDGEQAIGHCTFSSLVVDTPISGHLYA